MATLIAFSAHKGDSILVQETIDDARAALLPNALTADGFCQLTRVAKKFEVLDPVTVFVRPERIAYMHAHQGIS